jgi:RimJ/RimL family protein N-acetyltransferase
MSHVAGHCYGPALLGDMGENPDQQCSLKATPITQGDVLLTPVRGDDADTMLTVLQDRELYVFTGGEPPSIDELRRTYARRADGVSPDGAQLWLNWIVRVSGEPAGYVQATVVSQDDQMVAELAWVIGVRFQGRGLATRSAQLMCTWLRDHGVSHSTASIHPDHAASAAIATRLGLRRSGLITDDGESIWRTP